MSKPVVSFVVALLYLSVELINTLTDTKDCHKFKWESNIQGRSPCPYQYFFTIINKPALRNSLAVSSEFIVSPSFSQGLLITKV